MLSVFSKYRKKIINGALWSDYSGGLSDDKTNYFFERPVDSFFDGLNQITIEVSKAKANHPELHYFRNTRLLRDDLEEYLSLLKKSDDTFTFPRIEKIIKNGIRNPPGDNIEGLLEVYSNGSWCITDKKPWSEHNSGYDYR